MAAAVCAAPLDEPPGSAGGLIGVRLASADESAVIVSYPPPISMRIMPGCRRTLFEQLDRPALNALPATPYEYAEWRHAKVGIDYHIEVDRRCYSVPHALVGARVDVRLSAGMVEVLHQGTAGAQDMPLDCVQLALLFRGQHPVCIPHAEKKDEDRHNDHDAEDQPKLPGVDAAPPEAKDD